MEPASAFGPTVEVVVDPDVRSEGWLSRVPVGTRVAVTGALGRPFTLPRQAVPVLMVGVGADVSPLLELTERLRKRGSAVSLLLGADDEQHLFAAREARRLARHLHIRTYDGSVGERGSVASALQGVMAASRAAVVYAAGSPDLCRQVVAVAADLDVTSQVALRTHLPCGTGLCHGCVVPVTGSDGGTREVRACVEGPVLPGHRVDWAGLCGIPGEDGS